MKRFLMAFLAMTLAVSCAPTSGALKTLQAANVSPVTPTAVPNATPEAAVTCSGDFVDLEREISLPHNEWQQIIVGRQLFFGNGVSAIIAPIITDGGLAVKAWYRYPNGIFVSDPKLPRVIEEGNIYPVYFDTWYNGVAITYGPVYLRRCGEKLFMIDKNRPPPVKTPDSYPAA